jgi:hypothetical protein
MSWLSALRSKIAGWFGAHKDLLQTLATDGEVFTKDAAAVAAAAGEHGNLITVLGGVADGFGKISTTITAESSATTLAQHAADLTGLASGLLVTSTDVGVKNADTKAKIVGVLQKVTNVVGALQTAAEAQTGGPGTAPPLPVATPPAAPTAPGV